MSKTKRTQILMAPDEYQELARVARRLGVSVAELIRTAVRERYLETNESRKEAVAQMLAMEVDIDGDWESWEREVAEAHEPPLS